MPASVKAPVVLVVLAVALGFFLTRARKIPVRPSPALRTYKLEVRNRETRGGILLAPSAEGSPGLWLKSPQGKGLVSGGIHPTGLPFLLVSDAAIKNFGLGRQDGKNATPLLVFRSADLVKMVFGLSMTDGGTPPFLAHWNGYGKKTDVIGRYCDTPSRMCTQ